jgi:hypothetical protein
MPAALYKTPDLIFFMNSKALHVEYQYDEDNDLSGNKTSNYDLIIVEPTKVNFELSESNLEELAQSLRNDARKLSLILIIDSSYLGNTFVAKDYFTSLNNPNVIVLNVRSPLKLDQEGYEFCNVRFIEQ